MHRLDARARHPDYSLRAISRLPRERPPASAAHFALVLRIIPPRIPDARDLRPSMPGDHEHRRERALALVLVTHVGATGSGKVIDGTRRFDDQLHQPLSRRVPHRRPSKTRSSTSIPTAKASISQRFRSESDYDELQAPRCAPPSAKTPTAIILVGEMRDAESVDIALKASETGHMVFSTVHTTDAAKTIGRLVGVFPGDERLGGALPPRRQFESDGLAASDPARRRQGPRRRVRDHDRDGDGAGVHQRLRSARPRWWRSSRPKGATTIICRRSIST